jgi:hypothetical protein
MHTIVLRGDWEKLCRRGDRVWVRVRPYEVVWKTLDDFTVDDIRSVSIEPVQLGVMRKSRVPGRGETRVARQATTRIVIAYGTDGEVKMDLHEPESVVTDAFADLHDRFVAGEGVDEGVDDVDIDLVAEERIDPEADEIREISWKPVAEVIAVRDAEALVAIAANHDPDLATEVSFKLELGAPPEAVGRWLDGRVNPGDDAGAFSSHDEELFGDSDGHVDSSWVVKRRKRRLRHKLRGSGTRTSR